MSSSIGKILGAVAAIGLASACGGRSQSGDPSTRSSAGAAGVAGLASAGAAAGAGEGVAGAAQESGGAGASAGASGRVGGAGTGGVELYPPIDIGEQQTSNRLDVLFVVDNSGAMADKQKVLQDMLHKIATEANQ